MPRGSRFIKTHMKKKETPNNKTSALVLFSGGQDSATCLAWAMEKFDHVEAITFNYGQRHKVEITQAKKICKKLNIPQKILKLNLFQQLTKSALTETDIVIQETSKNTTLQTTHYTLPTSFVPGRNLIFLSTAAIHAHQLGIKNLVTGVCQTDYSGYPDCREEFITSLEHTINIALGLPSRKDAPSLTQCYNPKHKTNPQAGIPTKKNLLARPAEEKAQGKSIKLHTPLMRLTKADTVKMIDQLGHRSLLKHSHTCYKGKRPACGTCPACKLRLKGFKEAGIQDPLKYITS
jgi:7-cyano-7-deazaguanine synthase